MVAPTFTILEEGKNEANPITAPFSTGPFTITNGRVVIAAVSVRYDTPQPTLSGFGLTWTYITYNEVQSGSSARKTYVFWAQGAPSPATDALEVDFGQDVRTAAWHILQGNGNEDASSPIGVNASDVALVSNGGTIINSLTFQGAGGSTVAISSGTDNISSVAMSPGSWTSGTAQNTGELFQNIHWIATQETGPVHTYTISAARDAIAISVEVKSSGVVAGPAIPVFMHHYES